MLDDRNFEIRGKTVLFIVVVFPSLLLLTLLAVFIRWLCHASSPPPPEKGLAAAAIRAIPVVPLAAGAGECSICLGAFEDGERVKILPRCGHCFHPECVDRWLRRHPSCPICRDSLRVEPETRKIVVVVE